MSDEKDVKQQGAETSRREFVTTSAKVAITVPAVALLLSATTKPAAALSAYQAQVSHILDDFTYGNNKDDFVGPQDEAPPP